ncbi:MAG: efflux transporter outer membrane subunit [Candidatus Gastranaerophilaceae bacterium]|jgi:NodT family efflux transporter outer membrane factor (OMF) lipoprotein
MQNKKLITLILTISFLYIASLPVFAEAKKPSKALKGNVADYKAEYINQDWWSKFNDPILKGYIIKATQANHDLKIATLNVSEAQALMRESFGTELPSVSVSSNIGKEKPSGNTSLYKFLNVNPSTLEAFTMPLTVNYELDLWRKNRQKTLSLAKNLEAARYDEKSAYISLTSAVAADYLNAVKADKLIQIQKEIIDFRKTILDLTKIKNNEGLCPTTDVVMADKAFTEEQSALTSLEKQRGIFLNQLAVLTGESSDNSLKLERTSIDNIDLIKDLPLNVSSAVVLKRPDILKAEAQLQKSKIDVSIARKDFLPNIVISGQFGFNSNYYSQAFDWASHIASVGAGLSEPLFSGGQRHARLKLKKYQYQEMFENYQKTILTSFQEINDSLVSIKADTQKNSNDINRVNFEKTNLKAINAKYKEGMIAYLDTIQYKERVLSLEKEQIQSKTDCLIDSLSLYKAIGGKL